MLGMTNASNRIQRRIDQINRESLLKELNIAMAQMRCEKGKTSENVSGIISYLDEIAASDTDIACFPEMCVAGYVDPEKCPSGIQTWHDTEIGRIVSWSRGKRLTAIVGIIENNPNGKPFISQGVIRDGRLLGHYRKHTIKDEEVQWFSPGFEFPIFHHPKATFGVAICADVDNEAVFANYARQGAEVVFVAAAPGLYGEQAARNWNTGYSWWRDNCMDKLGHYARTYGIHIAVATQAGRTVDEDFPGGGYVFDSTGARVKSTADWSEGILYASIPVAE